MHTDIDYSKIPNEAERRKKAIRDIQNWVGLKKFKKVSSDVRNCQPPMTYAQFRMMCHIGGIYGYPVAVWAEDCGVPTPGEANDQNS